MENTTTNTSILPQDEVTGTIGKYKLTKFLGEGMSAKVKLAYTEEDGK